MRIGVALPARDVAPYIETCLTSIAAQTTPCSVYVVDDASQDGTTTWVTHRPSLWRRLHVNDTPVGWPIALNMAAAMAVDDGCDAIMVMNADDWLRLDCIEKLARALVSCDAAVPWTQQIGGENVVQASAAHVNLGDFTDHTPLVAFALVRAEVWKAVGPYDAAMNIPGLNAGYNEWEWWVRFHKAGFLHWCVEEPIVYYRVHPGQLSHRTTARHTLARQLIFRKHPDLAALAAEQQRQATGDDRNG